ncbi:carboxymethylenebutenolidase [Colletotrichum abscissum]|uniref:Carboxymethylenebutenolidase n=1 Tax=Colletotrichum abscissum TaxID=1671311 RepID=A0A9Q0AU37_9PEZI|nr:carboxymethylenebutenolidase [Colletotrichum abscissum]KAI3532515.1 carboxymethylenebutenolidase [Colletotrichum abscissum]KAK1472324.1 carboxymethylenebutenolidase [Colletotrichum abscissum]
MYADISKPPAPLPKAEPQCISEGVTLLPPLSRRGYGKGLIILQHDSTQHLDIVEGVPSALIKWAEEGFVVVEIQAKALTNPSLATDVLQTALKALKDCSKLEKDSRFGVVAFDPTLWNKIAGVACIFPDIVGAVVYADSSDENTLEKSKIPMLCHLAGGQAPSETKKTEGITTYRYAKAKSFRLATPFHEDFDYWSESLSHTRNLTFLKSLIGGPYFDLEAIWDEHTYYEFADRSVEHTMSTMVDQPYVNHVPTLTGGIGRGPLTRFYRNNFIFNNSQDTELELISRTLGIDRVVDEFIYKFTHDTVVDWLVPGIPPTYKKVEIPFTAVVNIRGDRLYHEHISWDQGTVLAQLGLMPQYLPFPYPIKGQEDGATFEYRVPVLGIDTAEKMRDRNSVVSNEMFNFKVRKS